LNESTQTIILLILAMILLLILAMFVSVIMSKRAVKAVLKMLRDSDSTTPETAKTAEEVGFKPRGFINFRGLRDYKPNALQLLIREGIIQVTEEGKIFLSEEKLAQHSLKKIDQ
jgi:hypothetical protein